MHVHLGSPLTPGSFNPTATADLPAGVQAELYGQMLVADFIGTASGQLRVAQLSGNTGDVAVYGGYVGGRLERLVLVSTQFWDEAPAPARGNGRNGGGQQEATPPRPRQTIQLSSGILPRNVRTVQVRKLTTDGGVGSATAEGLVYAGTRWSSDSKGLPVRVGDESSLVSTQNNGALTVDLDATSAVLVTW